MWRRLVCSACLLAPALWSGGTAQAQTPEIAVGREHTLAIKADGTLWAWGDNAWGQLGVETSGSQATPVQIESAIPWVRVAAGGHHTVALKADGTLWAWGYNAFGQVGDGTTTHRYTPVQISTDTAWVAIAAGYHHTLARKADGTLWAWGANGNGELGDGTTTDRHTPVQVGMENTWVGVAAAGSFHTLAVKADGTLWAWGFNLCGQLGDGTTYIRVRPVQIGTENSWVGIAAGLHHSLARKADGTLWAWGSNRNGELGDGTTTDRLTPVQVGTENSWVGIAAGLNHTLGRKADGTLWAWGYNLYGQLGDGTTTSHAVPMKLGTEATWVAVAAGGYRTLGLKVDGTLWAWGANNYGQLGDGTLIERHTPVPIGIVIRWAAAVAGNVHTLARRTDGTLWAWGYNLYGQLGDGTTTTYRPIPVQVGTDTNWTAVAAGGAHTLALKADGTLWAWGYNANGQLGEGTTANHLAPIQIGTDATWVAVAAGGSHSLALKANGTLWAWGYNGMGQIGDGTTTDRHIPVQIGTDGSWVAIATGNLHTLARRADGTLWAWGSNANGRLGDGTTTDRHAPVQVGAETTWVAIAAGGYHTLARRADGTLWTWGYNAYGQLGDGTTTDRHAPVQNGAEITWVAVAAGVQFSVILKANDTIWAWGANNWGQLGDGTVSTRLAPVPVTYLAKATLTNPPPGTTLPGSGSHCITFTRSAGSGAIAYRLQAGSTVHGSTDIAEYNWAVPSIAVCDFPTDGRMVYVRLYTEFSSGNQFADYTFTAPTAPILAFTGEAGYASDGVEPDNGTPGSSFTFRVTYRNPDGFPPRAGSPMVYIQWSDGTPVPGSGSSLTYVSGSITTGAIYTFSRTLDAGYYIHAFAAYASQGLAAALISHDGPTVDGTPPAITHTPVTSGATNKAITITATITDSTGVQTATVFYRATGASSFTAMAMTGTGSAYSATIPGSEVTKTGVQYYLEAHDPASNLTRVPSTAPDTLFNLVVGTTVFTDDPLIAQNTPIKALHFTELRAAINKLRAFNWQELAPAPGGTVRAAVLTEFRNALNAAYDAASKPRPQYVESITAGQTIIKAGQLTELRRFVRALE